MEMFGGSFHAAAESVESLFIHRVIYLQIELIRIYTTTVYLNHVRDRITYSLVDGSSYTRSPTPDSVVHNIHF